MHKTTPVSKCLPRLMPQLPTRSRIAHHDGPFACTCHGTRIPARTWRETDAASHIRPRNGSVFPALPRVSGANSGVPGCSVPILQAPRVGANRRDDSSVSRSDASAHGTRASAGRTTGSTVLLVTCTADPNGDASVLLAECFEFLRIHLTRFLRLGIGFGNCVAA